MDIFCSFRSTGESRAVTAGATILCTLGFLSAVFPLVAAVVPGLLVVAGCAWVAYRQARRAPATRSRAAVASAAVHLTGGLALVSPRAGGQAGAGAGPAGRGRDGAGARCWCPSCCPDAGYSIAASLGECVGCALPYLAAADVDGLVGAVVREGAGDAEAA